eukprot:2131092-Prorocentrum_lima.AAC.1
MQGPRDLISEINWDTEEIIAAKDLGPLKISPSRPNTSDVATQTNDGPHSDRSPPPSAPTERHDPRRQ